MRKKLGRASGLAKTIAHTKPKQRSRQVLGHKFGNRTAQSTVYLSFFCRYYVSGFMSTFKNGLAIKWFDSRYVDYLGIDTVFKQFFCGGQSGIGHRTGSYYAQIFTVRINIGPADFKRTIFGGNDWRNVTG